MDNYSLYQKLKGIDLGAKDDNYFRSLGVGFDRGRQDAIDYLARNAELYDPEVKARKQNEQVIAQAQALRDFNVKNNQPAIETLEKSSTDLQTRYKDLLTSIKGQQTVAENSQIRATSNELGRRGINNQSGIYEQEQADALRPIASQYQSLSANAGVAEQGDLNQLASIIASLKAGNPLDSAQLASGNVNSANSLAQQASQFAENLVLQNKQLDSQSAQTAADRAFQDKIYNTVTLPQLMYTIGKPYYKSTGGNSGGGLPDLGSIFG